PSTVYSVQSARPSAGVEQIVHDFPRPPGVPVRLLVQEAMDGCAVDPIRIVVQLVSTVEDAPHATILPHTAQSASPRSQPGSLRSQAPSTIENRVRPSARIPVAARPGPGPVDRRGAGGRGRLDRGPPAAMGASR